jgi:hypothetical protein
VIVYGSPRRAVNEKLRRSARNQAVGSPPSPAEPVCGYMEELVRLVGKVEYDPRYDYKSERRTR